MLPLNTLRRSLRGGKQRQSRRRVRAPRILPLLDDTVERVNITLPRCVLKRLDANAKQLGETRLQLHRPRGHRLIDGPLSSAGQVAPPFQFELPTASHRIQLCATRPCGVHVLLRVRASFGLVK
ncbi:MULTISPECIES: type II toxin-antitoxin system HicB family antitoxin [unclassified Lysobacter]